MKEYTNKSKNEKMFLYKTIFYIAILAYLFVRTLYEIYRTFTKTGSGLKIFETLAKSGHLTGGFGMHGMRF